MAVDKTRGAASTLARQRHLGYSLKMLLPVELTESQIESLRQRAKTLGISPEQLAAAAVVDLVSQPADDFRYPERRPRSSAECISWCIVAPA